MKLSRGQSKLYKIVVAFVICVVVTLVLFFFTEPFQPKFEVSRYIETNKALIITFKFTNPHDQSILIYSDRATGNPDLIAEDAEEQISIEGFNGPRSLEEALSDDEYAKLYSGMDLGWKLLKANSSIEITRKYVLSEKNTKTHFRYAYYPASKFGTLGRDQFRYFISSKLLVFRLTWLGKVPGVWFLGDYFDYTGRRDVTTEARPLEYYGRINLGKDN